MGSEFNKSKFGAFLAPTFLALTAQVGSAQDLSYTLVDTMQDICFDNAGDAIDCPVQGAELYGQNGP